MLHIFQEICRKNWMFKLVGRETFTISGTRAVINIDACSGFAYEYQLEVGGKSLEKFVEQRSRTCKVWTPTIDGVGHRIVLGEKLMFTSFCCCCFVIIYMLKYIWQQHFNCNNIIYYTMLTLYLMYSLQTCMLFSPLSLFLSPSPSLSPSLSPFLLPSLSLLLEYKQTNFNIIFMNVIISYYSLQRKILWKFGVMVMF